MLGHLEREQGPGEEKMLPGWQKGGDFRVPKVNWRDEEEKEGGSIN